MSSTTKAVFASERRGRLLQVLGVGFGLAVIIGNTIGAGIFRAPGDIASHLPHPWLFLAVWIIGGLYALLGAVSLAELGAMIPRSGGQYVFARYALGDYAGFIVGWSDWLSTCGSAAAVSLVLVSLLGAFSSARRKSGLDGNSSSDRFCRSAMARNRLGQRRSEHHQLTKGAGVPAADCGGLRVRRTGFLHHRGGAAGARGPCIACGCGAFAAGGDLHLRRLERGGVFF